MKKKIECIFYKMPINCIQFYFWLFPKVFFVLTLFLNFSYFYSHFSQFLLLHSMFDSISIADTHIHSINTNLFFKLNLNCVKPIEFHYFAVCDRVIGPNNTTNKTIKRKSAQGKKSIIPTKQKVL